MAVGKPLQHARVDRMLEEGVQGVDHDCKEERRYRVILAEPASMVHRRAWVAVDENPHGCSGDQDANPFAPAMSEAKVAKSLKKKGPRDGAQGLRNFELEKNARGLEIVKQTRRLLDKEEVVVHTPAGNECALVGGDDLAHPRCQTKGEDLGEKLGDNVDQTNWPIVRERGRVRFLGK